MTDQQRPLDVVIILGSETDTEVFEKSKMTDILTACDASFEVHVCSAHRNDEELGGLCRAKIDAGASVFVAAAGMAAALGGAITAKIKARRPVIAVALDSGFLGGLDALLATTRTPKGTPVLTVGVGTHGFVNAALAAIQILAVGDEEILDRLEQFVASNTPQPKQLTADKKE